MLDLTIIIVNYRCWDKLSICLDSLKEHSTPIKKVMVIDNFSNDGKLQAFKKNYAWVCVVEEKINGGFAYGCNVGAQLADSQWVLFLNPDTEIPKTFFETLLPFCEKHPDYKLISVKQINNKGKNSHPYGVFPNMLNVIGPLRSLERNLFKRSQSKRNISKKEIAYPDWISGAFILIRLEDYKKLGGWDDYFWMYYEDIDICKRANKLGMKRVILNKWTCIHNHGGASRKNIDTTILTKAEVIISLHKYIRKHFKGLIKGIALGLVFITTIIELGLLSLFSKIKKGILKKMFSYWFGSKTRI